MEIKAGVLERISQTISLFKNNFVGLFIPLFLYNFVSVVIIGTISKYYIINSLASINDFNSLDFFSFLNKPIVVISIIVGMVLFILYLFFYVVVLLGFLKSLRQAINSEKITILDNITYGISRFTNSMKTYWYIFAYIALIPSIIFIIGGLLFNAGYYYGGLEILTQAGIVLIIISLVIFLVFSIYRGTKSKFALYSAVNDDSFTKENFSNSINITNNNWWRIIGNFLLVGILIYVFMLLIGSIISILGFLGSGGNSMLEGISSSLFKGGQIGFPDMNEIKNILNTYTSNFSISGEILSNTIDNILKTISSVFVLIFTYVFFLRLKQESNLDIKTSENKEIEL